jgi:hypothetical protein
LKLYETKKYYYGFNSSIFNFEYQITNDLEKFTGSHPAVMRERIENDYEWSYQFDKLVKSLTKIPGSRKPFLTKISDWFEKKTGIRVGEFKDFIEVR